jgi:hypothetical protein
MLVTWYWPRLVSPFGCVLAWKREKIAKASIFLRLYETPRYWLTDFSLKHENRQRRKNLDFSGHRCWETCVPESRNQTGASGSKGNVQRTRLPEDLAHRQGSAERLSKKVERSRIRELLHVVTRCTGLQKDEHTFTIRMAMPWTGMTAAEDEQARFLVLLPLRPAGGRWAPAHLDVTGSKQGEKKHASRARIDLLPRARRAHHHQNGIHRPRRGLAFSITGVLPLVVPPARATFYCLTAASHITRAAYHDSAKAGDAAGLVTNQTAAADTKQDGLQAHATGGSGSPCGMRNWYGCSSFVASAFAFVADLAQPWNGPAVTVVTANARPRLHTALPVQNELLELFERRVYRYSCLCSRLFSTETEAEDFFIHYF